ncbi:MAG: hypothetical protein U1F77_08305 [Kiritimatiellia bacterium]
MLVVELPDQPGEGGLAGGGLGQGQGGVEVEARDLRLDRHHAVEVARRGGGLPGGVERGPVFEPQLPDGGGAAFVQLPDLPLERGPALRQRGGLSGARAQDQKQGEQSCQLLLDLHAGDT